MLGAGYNPCNGIKDSTWLYQGIELDDNGAPAAIWIAPPRRLRWSTDPKEWTRVPWYGEDGTPNVIHRSGLRIPGAWRAVTMYAPNLLLAKQVKGMVDAYAVAKRIQACHPIFIECENPVEAAKNDRNGVVYGPNTALEPGKVYYLAPGMKVTIPAWTFNGADMRVYLDSLYRNQFASWGMPIDVVLAQLGETNIAASRSAWQQYYRQCEIWQDEHIRQVSSILDECAIREAVARGELPASVLTPNGLASRYVRPPRAMPDPYREAQAVREWTDLGRDLTGLWAESGVDFRDSTLQRAEDDKLREAQGIEEPAPEQPAPAQPAEDGKPQENQDDEDTEKKPDAD